MYHATVIAAIEQATGFSHYDQGYFQLSSALMGIAEVFCQREPLQYKVTVATQPNVCWFVRPDKGSGTYTVERREGVRSTTRLELTGQEMIGMVAREIQRFTPGPA